MEQADSTVSTVDIIQQKIGIMFAPPMIMNTAILPINIKLGDSISEVNSSVKTALECVRRGRDGLEMIEEAWVGESGRADSPAAFSELSPETYPRRVAVKGSEIER